MPCPNSHRKRTISKAFRCSPEERHRIELLAKAAGVTQQEYIMAKIEDKEFTIVPDIRTFKMLRDEMRAVVGELSRLRNTGDLGDELEARVELLCDLFLGIADVESPLDEEDALIEQMGRGRSNPSRRFSVCAGCPRTSKPLRLPWIRHVRATGLTPQGRRNFPEFFSRIFRGQD